jgi:hypothetical protein
MQYLLRCVLFILALGKPSVPCLSSLNQLLQLCVLNLEIKFDTVIGFELVSEPIHLGETSTLDENIRILQQFKINE